jgi:hypothetical protein
MIYFNIVFAGVVAGLGAVALLCSIAGILIEPLGIDFRITW